MCAFNSNIPQPTDPKSQSQGEMLNNFTAINAFVDIDHGAFNGVLEGQHVKVTLPNAVAPVFPNPATDIGLYNANGVTSTLSEGYIHKHINGPAAIEVPFTESILGTNATPSDTGWTYLPSGILLKWGLLSSISSGDNMVNVNSGGVLGPNFTTIFTTFGTLGSTPTASIFFAISVAFPNININASAAAGGGIRWFVIGRGV